MHLVPRPGVWAPEVSPASGDKKIARKRKGVDCAPRAPGSSGPADPAAGSTRRATLQSRASVFGEEEYQPDAPARISPLAAKISGNPHWSFGLVSSRRGGAWPEAASVPRPGTIPTLVALSCPGAVRDMGDPRCNRWTRNGSQVEGYPRSKGHPAASKLRGCVVAYPQAPWLRGW